jgi:hypothetical protein
MALETGDVTQKDAPYIPPPTPEQTDPGRGSVGGDTETPAVTATLDPDVPAPIDTSGLSVIATIGVGGASFDRPLPDDWAAPTTPSIIDTLGQFLPTAEGMEKARQADIKYAHDKGVADEFFARQQEDRDRDFYRAMKSRLEQESASIQDIKPWNPVTMAPPKHDLWEQFGSPAFLIAMMASSFTAMPMVSALNSGAAAMNAINQGDLDAYNRAFDEWKANTNLAIQRHNLEHTEFEDIGQLWDKDQQAGKARLANYLTRIDDRRKLALLNAGMDDELWKSVSATHDAFGNIIKTIPEMLKTKAMVDTLNKDERWTKGTDRMGAYTDALRKIKEAETAGRYGLTLTAQQQARINERVMDWQTRNPKRSDESDEDYAKRRDDAIDDITRQVISSYKPLEERKVNLSEWKAQEDKRHHEVTEQVQQGKLTVDQARQQEDARHKQVQDDIAAGRLSKEVTAEAEKERHDKAMEDIAKLAKTQLTPNKAAELRIASDRYRTGVETIDKLLALIKKHVGAVGAAGYATRAAESLSNVIAGSSASDRKEIERLLNELQMLTPRLITESTSRPMASEHEHVSSVVGGLKAGDTRPNVLRNLEDLRVQLVTIKGKMDDIISGKPFEPDTDIKTETPKTDSEPEWKRGIPTGTP